MSSSDRELPDFPEPTPEERLWLMYLHENPPRLTWDEYIKAVDELSQMHPPNREIRAWEAPFEL